MITVITFFVILSLLVLVHELGHFVSAKRMGIRVEEFGFGFPPRLIGFKIKETLYSINALPLGGFVKIKGIADDEKDDGRMNDPDSFATRKIWQRMLVVSGGVLANMGMAAILLIIGFRLGIPTVIDETIGRFGMIRNEKVQIFEIKDNFPASKSDFKIGDEIISLNGQTVKSPDEFRAIQNQTKDQPITIEIRRGKDIRPLSIVPEWNDEFQRYILGLSLVKTGLVSYPIPQAIGKGIIATGSITGQMFQAFGHVLKNLFIRQEIPKDLAGPVGIAVLTGQIARQGFSYLLQFTALLSINIAIINFLPFPALDGGRFIFLAIEKIRGKSIRPMVENRVNKIGFALLLFLILMVTARDINQAKGSIYSFFQQLF